MDASPHKSRTCLYNNGRDTMAAIITNVHDDGIHVDLAVFPHDKGNFGLHAVPFDALGSGEINTAYYSVRE